MTTDDTNPGTNTTFEVCDSDLTTGLGTDLASEPLGRHNLSDAGEGVVDNYESVSSIGNEVEEAVIELHERQIENMGCVTI